jgi:hypothetical protein
VAEYDITGFEKQAMLAEAARTPYPEPGGQEHTAGWAGSEASHERAVRERDTGITAQRQDYVRDRLRLVGGYGVTVKELRDRTNWHHGQASSTLTVMHKAGDIACLAEKREGCHVYVLPDFVQDRETREPGTIRRTKVNEDDEFRTWLMGFLIGQAHAGHDYDQDDLRVVFDSWKATQ